MLERSVVIGTDKKAEPRGKSEHFKVVMVKDNAALMLEDMGFANADKLDFRMAADAPVFKKWQALQQSRSRRLGSTWTNIASHFRNTSAATRLLSGTGIAARTSEVKD